MSLDRGMDKEDIGFPGGSGGNLPAMQETQVQSLGWKDPLEKGNGYPLQYSFLENSVDRGVWGTTVHGGAKSQTQLRD